VKRFLPRVRGLGVALVAIAVLSSSVAGIPAARAEDKGQSLQGALQRQRELQQQIATQTQTINDLRAAEAKLQAALTRTKSQLDDIGTDLVAVRQDIVEATAALQIVEARHARLVAELEHLDWRLGILQEEVVQADEDLVERRRLLAQRLAEAYRIQQTSLLEQIITARSFSDVLVDVGSHLRFGNQDAQLAGQIELDQRALEVLRKTTAATRFRTEQVRLEVHREAVSIQQQRARLLESKKRLELLEAETKRIQAQQVAAYRQVVKTEQQAEALLRSTRVAQVRLSAEIARLIQEQSGLGNIPSAYNGIFQWPLEGRISQEFGCTGFSWEPPLGNCPNFHRGIDVVAADGAPITTPADGVVLFVGFNPHDDPSDPAFIVLVAHSTDLVTWYAHLQPIVPPGIQRGAKVKAGDVIGYQGNTGRSTGSHLHWMVQLDGQFVNPRLFV
jgi:murein DD-endopeptidase MepM/ murein hydrolase activator NlpD